MGTQAVLLINTFLKGLLPLNREDKDAITMLSVKFVSRDVGSFETLSGERLIALKKSGTYSFRS